MLGYLQVMAADSITPLENDHKALEASNGFSRSHPLLNLLLDTALKGCQEVYSIDRRSQNIVGALGKCFMYLC